VYALTSLEDLEEMLLSNIYPGALPSNTLTWEYS
jgi:hypothetical protein